MTLAWRFANGARFAFAFAKSPLVQQDVPWSDLISKRLARIFRNS